MILRTEAYVTRALFAVFVLFLLTSTFSIAASQSALGISILLFFLVLVFKRHHPLRARLGIFYASVFAYVIWIGVSSLVGHTPLKSVLMEKEDWLFMAVPTALYLLSIDRYRHRLISIFAFGVMVMAIYGIVQHFTGLHLPGKDVPPPALGGGYFAEGTFAHHLTFGNYYAVATFFLLGYALLDRGRSLKSARGFIVAAALLGLAATVFSYARMAVAAIVPTLIFLAALRGRRWFAGMAAAGIAVAVLSYLFVPGIAGSYRYAIDHDFAANNEGSRVFIWKRTVQIIEDHKLFGIGQGNYPAVYAALNDSTKGETRTWPHAHNDLLNITALSGIPGGLLFLAIWVALFRLLRVAWRRLEDNPHERALIGAALCGSVIFVFCSLTEAAFADEEVRQLLMFVWAAGLWPYVTTGDGESEPLIMR